jgi:7,8-dihydro-6-hydroxymethylpterin dimethyltransferase
MKTLGMTQSVCPTCRQIIPAKVITDGQDVYFKKFCPEHGEHRNLVRRNVDDYLQSLRFVKPAWVPKAFSGKSDLACPEGCGFCSRHEQHLCMPIVEITTRCNLSCPVCLVDAGREWDMPMEEFKQILDTVIHAERQIDILNLSGGEPLLHPGLLSLIDEALSRPQIIRVSISTNGLAFLARPDLLRRLHERNVVVSLQFDGFDDHAYEILRGRRLLSEKIEILELLANSNLSTSLTVTVAGKINTDQFPGILDYFFSHAHIVSMMIQPVAFAGRAQSLAGRAEPVTIPEVIGLLETAGRSRVTAADFAPLPCSHPLCFSLAYFLMLDEGGSVAVNRLMEASKIMDTLANRTIFGLDGKEYETIKDLIYDLWSGPAGSVPDAEGVLRTLRSLMDKLSCGCFDPRRTFTLAERKVKSIFIHAFQDARTFDLARVRRCCNAYPQSDGRLMPACVYNVYGRKSKGGTP